MYVFNPGEVEFLPMRLRVPRVLLALAVALCNPGAAPAVADGLTKTVFGETMATNPASPWLGTGCDNAWSVAYAGKKNPFEQAANANDGSGNTNGLVFKGNANTTRLSLTI
jgi:hypothetical protein